MASALHERLLKLHTLPRFGSTPLGWLETAKVRTWLAAVHIEHPTTAAGAYRRVRTILNTAVEDSVIPLTPAGCPVPRLSTLASIHLKRHVG